MHSKRMRMFFDISADKIELNMWGWIMATSLAMTYGCVPIYRDRFIFNNLHRMLPGLPFFRKVPVTKLIHIIIERGFNEGKMFLTFECHSLLLPAVLWLLWDKARLLLLFLESNNCTLMIPVIAYCTILNEIALFTVIAHFTVCAFTVYQLNC